MDGIFLHACFVSSIGWTSVPQALPRPLIRRGRLRFIFLCLLRKAYRRYILASKEFTCLGLLAFLWINLNENNMKIGNSHNYYVHNINIVHRRGICLEANAFMEFGKYNYYKSTTLSRIMLVQADTLLIILSQVFNIPRMLQFSPIQGRQVVGSLPFAIDNLIGSFPVRSQFPISWIFGCQRDPFQNKVSYVETPRFHYCIILPSHEVLIPYCPLLCVQPHLVYQIQIQAQLFLVILVLILHYLVIGQMYFCRYNCFTSISQFERSFPCGGSDHRPVGPQNTWQLVQPYSL